MQDVQDEMSDMLEQTNEIMDVLGTPYGLPDDVDEADLEAGTCAVHLNITCSTYIIVYVG